MAGQTKMCTVTNTQTATLKVIKHLDNTYFGPYDVSTFQFRIEGNNPTPTEFAGSESGTNVTLGGGTYIVDEFATAQGYTVNYSRDCTGRINPGETKTCTVTNTAHFGKVKVIKHVVGGTASASQFEIGYSYTCDPEFGCSQTAGIRGNESGTDILMVQGTYQIEELPPQYNPPGYTPTYSGDCSGHIGSGETKTSTVTNTYTPQVTLRLIKQVINDNGGTAQASDFKFQIVKIDCSGNLGTIPDFVQASEEGVTIQLNPRVTCGYDIKEIFTADYSGTPSGDCQRSTLSPGATYTCTYTNNDNPPRPPAPR